MKTKYIVLLSIGGALLLGSILAFTLPKKVKEPEKKPEPEPKPDPVKSPANPAGNTVTAPVNTGFPLKQSNVVDSNVKILQGALRNTWHDLAVAIDGKLGPITTASVLKAGYKVPVSKADFEAILAGKKPQTAPAPPTIKNGDIVYARVDGISTYTKPVFDPQYLKQGYKIFDKIGLYYGPSTVAGWTKVFSAALGAELFIPTAGITNVKP